MPALFALFFVLVVAVIVYSWLQAEKRRRILAAYAVEHGLEFSGSDPFDLEDQLEQFKLMQSGHSRGACNVLWGDHAGSKVILFEYSHKTGSGKHQTTHSFVCCQWQLPVSLVPMAIRPEGLFDRMAEWFGHNDIDFESSEFSRRYHVTGDDPREVYAVIDQRMMGFLMESGLDCLEITGNQALTYRDESDLSPERCDWFLALSEGFNSRLPPHLVREKGGLVDADRAG